MIQKTPIPNHPHVPFPFGVEFQAKLVRVMLLDAGLTDAILKYVKPHYFEAPPLRWAVQIIQNFKQTYNANPTITVLQEQARMLDPSIRATYSQAVHHLQLLQIPDEGWIKDQVLEWVKRNIFVEAHSRTKNLFNQGSVTEAYDEMCGAMDEIKKTVWSSVDRGWLFEEVGARESRREKGKVLSGRITCGVYDVDKLLGGGCEPGFFGVWMAYSKGGKSIMLQNQGLAAARAFKKTLHVILEGNRQMIEDRYDAAFSEEVYAQVKIGKMSTEKYSHLHAEYEILKGLIVLRAFTDRWDASILDIEQELDDLRRNHGWVPQLIIIDYGDLLSPRKEHGSVWEGDREVYRDMKTLSNRGFVVWTASQIQRPAIKDHTTKEHVLSSKDIAGGYDKIRVCDFAASLNSTLEERVQKKLRIFPEIVRDAPGGKVLHIGADWEKMRFGFKPESILGYDPMKIKKVVGGQ